MRKLATYKCHNGKTIKVYRNTDTDEYVCRFYATNGKHMNASDYFTNDKQDALDTAAHFMHAEDKAHAKKTSS